MAALKLNAMHGTTEFTPAADGSEDQPILLKPAAVAFKLSVSERYVWTLMELGELEYKMLAGRRMIPMESVLAFVSRLKADEDIVRAGS